MRNKQVNVSDRLFPTPVSQEHWQVETSAGTLYGTLDLPEIPENARVILMISGSGPTDRDGNSTVLRKPNDSLKMLGGHLVSLGFAVLRYDKRGVAASSAAAGDMANTRFDDMVDDARAWIDKIAGDPRFGDIGVLGHSEGSLVALLAATDDRRVRFAISVAGAGRPIGQVIREQLQPQPGFIRKKALAILSELEEGRRVEKVPFYLAQLFGADLQSYFISWNAHDPAALMRELDIPVLVIQGETDIQTAITDAELLASAGKDARLHIIPGMNHILKDAPAGRIRNIMSYTKPGLPLSSKLIEVLNDFSESLV
jgi:pimeloyl-ACP methyl ester carboxylesterase